MTKTEKVTFSVYIDKDIKDHMDSNPLIKSPSEWVSRYYRENFMKIKVEEQILKKLKVDEEKCKSRIKMLKDEGDNILSNISKEAVRWLKKEGIERINKYPLKNVLSFFNKEFSYRMKEKQFKRMISMVKEG